MARDRASFQLLGPMDLTPTQVRLSRPLDQLDFSVLRDRFVVSSLDRSLALVFGNVAGTDLEMLARSLRVETGPGR